MKAIAFAIFYFANKRHLPGEDSKGASYLRGLFGLAALVGFWGSIFGAW